MSHSRRTAGKTDHYQRLPNCHDDDADEEGQYVEGDADGIKSYKTKYNFQVDHGAAVIIRQNNILRLRGLHASATALPPITRRRVK